ncbi:MAG: hypothetical protein LBI29_00580 [Rickettsiales bacterium]|jgi:hypothetical protein|nr:hypothetical protein [Rickettsiales bacterium]
METRTKAGGKAAKWKERGTFIYWENNKIEGRGTYHYKNGNKYEVEWKGGKCE